MKLARSKWLTIAIIVSGLLSISDGSYANYWNGSRAAGANTNVYYDSSFASYGYTPHMDQARANWNSVGNSKVSFAHPLTTTGYGNLDKAYIGYHSFDTTTFAGTWHYSSSGSVIDNWSSNFDHASMIFYDNIFAANSFTYNQVVKTMTHELGHTIGLAHPTQTGYTADGDVTTAVPVGAFSVMYKGQLSYWVQTYDSSELKKKYP